MVFLTRLEIIIRLVLTIVLVVIPFVRLFRGQRPHLVQLRRQFVEQLRDFIQQAKQAAEIDRSPQTTTSSTSTDQPASPQPEEIQEHVHKDEERNKHENDDDYQAADTVDVVGDILDKPSKDSESTDHTAPEKTQEDLANQEQITATIDTPPQDTTDDSDALQDDKDTNQNNEHDQIKKMKKLETIKFTAIASKERGKMDQYEKKLIEGLALDPDNIHFLKMLGEYYFDAHQDIKALTLLKKVVNIEPEDHKSIRYIGQIYRNQGQHSTAQLLIEKAISLKTDHPKYYISLVEIYYDAGDIHKAIQTMETLLKLRPTNTDYLLTMATLYEEDKKPTLAHKYFSKVLEIDPSNTHAKKGMKRVK